MTEFKEGDRVKVTQVIEGTVEFDGSAWLRVRGDDGSTQLYFHANPGTTIEKIDPPLPDGQILYDLSGRAYAPIPGNLHYWRDLLTGQFTATDLIEVSWNDGELSTERPA